MAGRSVAIVALGPSCATYMHIAKACGGRAKVADEVWAINAMGDVIQCDAVFHMDDVRIQQARLDADPKLEYLGVMLDWLRTTPGPVFTSRKVDGFPGLVEYPLQEVIEATGQTYFNNTAAYAIAKAIVDGFGQIQLYGLDYTYAEIKGAEKGRGCAEFWIGQATARGIEVYIAPVSSLMDTNEARRFYGYDMCDVEVIPGVEGAVNVTLKDRENPPSGAEMNDRYDHTKVV